MKPNWMTQPAWEKKKKELRETERIKEKERFQNKQLNLVVEGIQSTLLSGGKPSEQS